MSDKIKVTDDQLKIQIMADALREISEGAGPFSMDPLTHAGNCIDSMKERAVEALEKCGLHLTTIKNQENDQ